MRRWFPLLTVLPFLALPQTLRADAFDLYTNPILAKAPGADGVKEIKKLTPEVLADHIGVLPGTTSAMVIVRTNENRFSKLLVQAARQKLTDENKTQLPILLIERYVTYREDQERAVQIGGQNVRLFEGFHFSLDLGQVVPAALGGDLRFVATKDGDSARVYAEPVGKAKFYLLTKPMPEATPKKTDKLVVGQNFELRYFNGTYKLHEDGRRSGNLTLKVDDEGNITGSFYSDLDGAKYEVRGKAGAPRLHAIQFTISLPRLEQVFQGFLFTGNGKAIAGIARLQDREAGFYAVRVEEE